MIEHAGSSEQGPVRPNNEDFIAHHSPEETDLRLSKGSLFVVADGVGGGLAGEVASKQAAETLISLYYSSPRRSGKALQEAFQQANLHVYDLSHTNPDYRKMQTTLSAIALINNQGLIGHVGDSRIYQVRGHEIEQMTRDHSEVGELVRMQIISPDEARHHPRRNVITRSVGSELMLQAEFRNIEVELGDIFVMCTDGLWEPVEERDIVAAVTNHSVSDAGRILLDLGIERGTSDNLSIQLAKVVEWEREPAAAAPRKEGLIQRAFRIFSRDQKGL